MSRARDLADGTFSGAFSADSPTLVVDAANNRVGVGTASPTTGLHLSGSGNSIAVGTNGEGIAFGYDNGGYNNVIFGNGTTNFIGFQTAGSEAARINANRTLLVGTTATFSSTVKLALESNCSAGVMAEFNNTNTSTTDNIIRFRRGGTETGKITTTTSNTTQYLTSSDYRLKENITELTGAIDRVKQVPVHRFNFIVDPDKTVDGFLAHEVQAVVPEAISGEKDAMKIEEYEVTPAVLDDDGNVVTEAVMGTREVPDYQGIDQSKLVPLLTAAIKEQQALIEDLQTRLAALETP